MTIPHPQKKKEETVKPFCPKSEYFSLFLPISRFSIVSIPSGAYFWGFC